MNQTLIRDIYLRVIDTTVGGVRDELLERAVGENVMDSLDLLKQRWEARLTQTHDFSDDPNIKQSTSTSSRGSNAAKKKKAAKKTQSAKKNKSPSASSSRNGVMSLTNLTNNDDEEPLPLPSVPRLPPTASSSNPIQPKTEKVEVIALDDQPPTKRVRTHSPPPSSTDKTQPIIQEIDDDDGGSIINHKEDLDSDDSDVDGDESDEEAENLVLAQHEKVKKGSKWKIILREGIVSIDGREYLFNKATCDLDF